MKWLYLAALALLTFSWTPQDSHALTYIIDFDSLTPGSAAATLSTAYGDLRLTTNATRVVGYDNDWNPIYSPTRPLIVSTGYQTTSGRNYLGVHDGETPLLQQFAQGDKVFLDFTAFSRPVVGISANFIVTAFSPPGAFSLSAANAMATSSLPFATFDPDLSDAFLVALSRIDPFQTATLGSAPDGLYSFSIDDITLTLAENSVGGEPVPEPSSFLLLGAGGALLYAVRRRTRRDQSIKG